MAEFTNIYGTPPEFEASAPGRVNLLGEHTDYNDGFVLPIAIPQRTRVELAHSPDEWSRFFSQELGGPFLYRADEPVPAGYGAYVAGCLEVLREKFGSIPPLNLLIRSEVPMGAGLSSSAALEVAILRGVRGLLGIVLDDTDLACLAQRAEIRFAGVRCGIMDQMAASLADERHMLFLDTRTLQTQRLPLPEQGELLVIDSGVPRQLADSAYNQRRLECEEAARLLDIPALRDIYEPEAADILPEPLDRRARHVVSENRRVLRAALGVSAEEFGELMNASHASLRDDFQVSVPALDALVELLQSHSEVFGARLTGAGFGGACVALVRTGCKEEAAGATLDAYGAQGHHGRVLV